DLRAGHAGRDLRGACEARSPREIVVAPPDGLRIDAAHLARLDEREGRLHDRGAPELAAMAKEHAPHGHRPDRCAAHGPEPARFHGGSRTKRPPAVKPTVPKVRATVGARSWHRRPARP